LDAGSSGDAIAGASGLCFLHRSAVLEGRGVGTKKTGKGRRKVGRKKRRMRAKIRHRKR
jgi:hypothetical protein